MIILDNPEIWVKQEEDKFSVCCGSEKDVFYSFRSFNDAVNMARLLEHYHDTMSDIREFVRDWK